MTTLQRNAPTLDYDHEHPPPISPASLVRTARLLASARRAAHAAGTAVAVGAGVAMVAGWAAVGFGQVWVTLGLAAVGLAGATIMDWTAERDRP